MEAIPPMALDTQLVTYVVPTATVTVFAIAVTAGPITGAAVTVVKIFDVPEVTKVVLVVSTVVVETPMTDVTVEYPRMLRYNTVRY